LLVDSFLSLITAKHIFVSAGEKNRARKIKFLDEHNSTVIHNGVDCEHIQNLSIAKNEIFESIGCDDWKHNKILGTISRISPEKGMHNLLSAFSKVIQKIPDLRLIIVGGYPEEHKNYYLKIINFIKKEDLTEHVRILGYRKDALEILKCMDFYISPSLSEGLPISILEAISSRIPIVATEIAGNKDILRNSAFGILVEPNSPECLSLGIIRITQLTQNELNILTRNAYNRIKKEFSVEEMASKTVLLYKKILHKNDAYEAY
jgi:glycosyltransferase involved in cell wall biosynthesis